MTEELTPTLLVRRPELAKALRDFRSCVKKRRRWDAHLYCEMERLVIATKGAHVSIEAHGWWPVDIVVPMQSLMAVVDMNFRTDPVVVSFLGGELNVDTVRLACERMSQDAAARRCGTGSLRPIQPARNPHPIHFR